jgi:NodT family efflux transporter outer membrane factor (OMF) lipoprotein
MRHGPSVVFLAASVLLGVSLPSSRVLAQSPAEPEDEVYAEPWWLELGDVVLIEFLREAAAANGDLEAAVQRMLQAEASVVRARSALLPTVAVDAQSSTGPLDGLGFQFGGIPRGDDPATLPSLYYTGSANLRARYRLSAWGAEYRSLRASRLESMATRGDQDGVALDLVGQVATTYFDAASAARQMEVITRQLEVSEQLAELSQLRYERGEASALEVLQQRQQLATIRATLPPARAELRLAQVRLETLLGREPSGTSVEVPAALPGAPGVDGVLMVADPVHRPDVRGAADRLEAAGARASEARWSVLPTVELSANTGSQFFRSIGTNTQSTWGASLTVSLPLLDGFDRSGRIREASANAGAARSSYEQLQRTASAQMVSAAIQQGEQREQLEALSEQLEASQRAFDESRRRYLAGLASVLDVLNAMNGMQQAELGVIRTQRTVLGSWIDFRQAVGGPWTQDLRRRLLES